MTYRSPLGDKEKTENDNLSFSVDAADKTGTSRRTVERSVSRAENIPEDVRDSIRDTSIADNGAELDALAKMEPETQREVVEKIKAGEAESVRSHGVLVQKFTGDEEWYTPERFISSARAVMGGIDIDPASNEFAQGNIQAKTYYTKGDDGLSQPWYGRLWMNPPYTARVINRFIEKAVGHYRAGDVTQAIILTNSNTDTSWFHQCAQASAAVCFTSGRISFHKHDGARSCPTNGQAFFYLGEDTVCFKEEFSKHGLVMVLA